jgi:hypothetical protein
VKFAQQFEQQHPHLLQIDAARASRRLRKKNTTVTATRYRQHYLWYTRRAEPVDELNYPNEAIKLTQESKR